MMHLCIGNDEKSSFLSTYIYTWECTGLCDAVADIYLSGVRSV